MIVHLAADKCTDPAASFSIKDNDKVVMLIIESGNFPSMTAIMIDGAENLEYLIFGDTTISYIPGGSGRRLPDTTKTFQITNSPKLAYIQIGDRMFTDFTEFTMSNLPSLRLLQIGSENFKYVSRFSLTSKNMNEWILIDRFPKLEDINNWKWIVWASYFILYKHITLFGNYWYWKWLFQRFFKSSGSFNDFPELLSLKIGNNSFYNEDSNTQINRPFSIYNNSKLLSIEIGEYSFGNYNGDFKVMSNPKLQSLTIGSIENESNNFMYVRNIFIEGIRMCVFEWILDLDSLTTLIIGCGSFRQYATSLTITSIRLFYNEI